MPFLRFRLQLQEKFATSDCNRRKNLLLEKLEKSGIKFEVVARMVKNLDGLLIVNQQLWSIGSLIGQKFRNIKMARPKY